LVRRGWKSGQPGDIPLLPMALRALNEWLKLRETWCSNNFKELVFPAERGGYRSAGKIIGREHQKVWGALLAKAEIRRHLVWHDLRHTCATALLGGFFGKRWRLEEIQQLLGHADIETTQLYAHALKQTLNDVAKETTGDIKARDRKVALDNDE
jgi:integrase